MKPQHHTRSGSTNIVYVIVYVDVDAGPFDARRLVELRSNTPPNEEVFPPGAAAQHLTPHETVALVALLLDGAKDAHSEPQSLFGATLSRLHGAAVAALSTRRGTVSIVDGAVVCSLCGGSVAEVDHAERLNDHHLAAEEKHGPEPRPGEGRGSGTVGATRAGTRSGHRRSSRAPWCPGTARRAP